MFQLQLYKLTTKYELITRCRVQVHQQARAYYITTAPQFRRTVSQFRLLLFLIDCDLYRIQIIIS